MALDRSGELALTLGSRLLVELTRTQFGQQTGFFNGTLETSNGYFERLIFLQANGRH